jgi:four helix bundle protein
MQRFTDLKVWQRSHELTLAIYRASASFPRDERYGLTSQLRRAMMSVPTNIAEGAKRQSQVEFARFLNIAEASLAEADYLLLLAGDLNYLPGENVIALRTETEEISRMLNGLRDRIESAL